MDWYHLEIAIADLWHSHKTLALPTLFFYGSLLKYWQQYYDNKDEENWPRRFCIVNDDVCTKPSKKFESLCDDNLCRKSALVRKSNHSVMTALSEKCVSDRQQASAKCIMDNDDRPICTELLYYVKRANFAGFLFVTSSADIFWTFQYFVCWTFFLGTSGRLQSQIQAILGQILTFPYPPCQLGQLKWSQMACTGVPQIVLHILCSTRTYWGHFRPCKVSFSALAERSSLLLRQCEFWKYCF